MDSDEVPAERDCALGPEPRASSVPASSVPELRTDRATMFREVVQISYADQAATSKERSKISSTRMRRASTVGEAALRVEGALKDTEVAGMDLFNRLLHELSVFWHEFASPLWLPLLGLATVGIAFTVPLWLAILDLLVGLPLVHTRAWQDWVRISCARCGPNFTWDHVERFLACTAVLLSLVTLLNRVIWTNEGTFSFFDLFFVAFAAGGAGSAWCRRKVIEPPHMREVPMIPVLVLLLAITTLAPVPALASLPYCLLFLALLEIFVRRSNSAPLGFYWRLCLLMLTTTHLLALLTLSFWGKNAPQNFIATFGLVGSSVTSDATSRPFCSTAFSANVSGPCASGNEDIFWPGMHISSLLLLHYVLTNVGVSRRAAQKKPSQDPSELTAKGASGSKNWVKLGARWALFATLATLVLWLPSLLSLPLLFLALTLTVCKSSLEGDTRECLAACWRRGCRACGCCSGAERPGRDSALRSVAVSSMKGALIFVYSVFIFLLSYVFNIAQGELPGRPPVDIWSQKLHLTDQVPVPSARSWFECIGMHHYGAGGAAQAAAAFFPQATLLTCIATLESILKDAHAPRHRSWQLVCTVLERSWNFVYSTVIPEVSMVTVLFLVFALLNSEEGRASVFVVCYMLVLAGLLLARKHSRLWLVLQVLSEFGFLTAVLVYVMATPGSSSSDKTLQLPEWLKNFFTAKGAAFLPIATPHLGIALCAGLQRACLHYEAFHQNPRSAANESEDELHMDDTANTSSVSWLERLVGILDRKTLKRFKLLAEECLLLMVMILALVTALLPPTDVHSLLLVGIVGPALLTYHMQGDRQLLLIKVLYALQYLTVFYLVLRVVVASPLMPLPNDEGWPISLQELGANRPCVNTLKLLFMGFTAILTRIAMQEARLALKDMHTMRERAADELEQQQPPSSQYPGIAPPAGGGAVNPADDSRGGPLEEPELPTAKGRRRQHKHKVGPPREELVLTKWAPGWLPVQAHAYFSALLLIVSFAVSITEVHVLNFLMISAVVSLCGWKELWVQAGNVFSVSTVGIMLLQYVARFHYWDGNTKDTWMKVVGLQWSSAQVVRHCAILVLCLIQKQLWHRGRYSKPREPRCPDWLSRHADLVGMVAILVVAVSRRHFWSPLLAVTALPWLIREEWEEFTKFSWFLSPGAAMTRRWLRFFRAILLLTLLAQVAMRLLAEPEFHMEATLDAVLSWSCTVWQDTVTFLPPRGEAPQVAWNECIQEWHHFINMEQHAGGELQLLWEFLALFFLGVVQQLFEKVEDEASANTQSHRWKLVAMHWWPCLLYLLTFSLSLEGGTILGLAHLVLLFGVAFNSSGELAARRRWAWRTQLCAWFFLFAGLLVQSPLLPCGHASCTQRVHRVFVRQLDCVSMQNFNMTEVESEAQTQQCGVGDARAEALGHDTFSTLAMQSSGLRRIGGSSIVESFNALFGSQLGVLLTLILVASVQVRIYNSAIYRKQIDETFMSEPQSLWLERARRYVHEFHCRCRLEELAVHERHRALRDKLKRTMTRINEILVRTREGNTREDRNDILVEELQLNHGIKKETARDVTRMFEWDMSLSKAYLNLLTLVMLGRLQPDGALLQKNYERLARALQQRQQPQKSSPRPMHLPALAPPALPSGETHSSFRSKVAAAAVKAREVCTVGWQSFQEKCEEFRRGVLLARCINDYAFMGQDEINFTLRPATAVVSEELHEHRASNGPIRLLWKVLLSNMANLVAVATVAAFIETRSILDMLRTFVVFFVAVRQYPFPPREFWTVLRAYSVLLLVLRTFYDLPLFCAGPSIRSAAHEDDQDSWEPSHSVKWCSRLAAIGWDIIVGLAKRRGPSALSPCSSWFGAVWADHLCIWTVLLHQWMLTRSGLWDLVTYDAESKQVVLNVGDGKSASQGPCGRASNQSTEAPLMQAHRHRPGPKDQPASNRVSANSTELEAKHQSMVLSCTKLRDRFISEYYEMLERVMQARRAAAARKDAAEAAEAAEAPALDQSGRGPPSSDSDDLESVPTETTHNIMQMSANSSVGQVLAHARSQLPGGLKMRLPRSSWLLGSDHSPKQGEHRGLYNFIVEGEEESVQHKIRLLTRIQRAVRRFLDDRRKHQKIRCLMGHPLRKNQPLDLKMEKAGPARNMQRHPTVAPAVFEVCEVCSQVIRSEARYSCKLCDYHACNDCVKMLIDKNLGMGKQDPLSGITAIRPGISLYWLKYILGLCLLAFAIVSSQSIFKSESRNFSESIQSNNVSVNTLIVLTVHLFLLVSDRIFHKWHYRNSQSQTSNVLISALNVTFLIAEFLWIHIHIIHLLANSANPREAELSLHQDFALCTYYVGWMLYFGVCLTQNKHGLPAVDHDTLRPSAPPETVGIFIEKLQILYWYFHYYLPFVDDIRVITDWSVMPTSLDLWMHFKVEDAHNWLFRTRHVMYVRRQSFFAEEREACEKVYSGWLVLLLVVFIILMPVVVFSPITPFPNSVPIVAGEAKMDLFVASSCVEGQLDQSCRTERILLYKADASQIITYSKTRQREYLKAHPKAATDSDIEDVVWPNASRVAMKVSPLAGKEVQALFDMGTHEAPVMAFFKLVLQLQRKNNEANAIETGHAVCFCSPQGTCKAASLKWPPSVQEACVRQGVTVIDSSSKWNEMQNWWRSIGRGQGTSINGLDLPGLWSPLVSVKGSGRVTQTNEMLDLTFQPQDCTTNCQDGWCDHAHCWGSLASVGEAILTVTYELERSAMLKAIASSSNSLIGLYIAVVLVAGRYMRAAFQDSSKRAIYEEIPDVGAFLDLVTAIKLAREHRDLRTEFQLYYCLMKVLRSTHLLVSNGGYEPIGYGAGRSDEPPPECHEPRSDSRLQMRQDTQQGRSALRDNSRPMSPRQQSWSSRGQL